MKVKLSLIPFIPIVIAMTALKLLGVFSLDSNGTLFGLSYIELSYTVVGLALVLFLFCILFNIIDRKTAPVYAAGKNIPAAVFGVLSAAFVLGSSALDVIEIAETSQYSFMYMISAIFAVLAAIAFIFMARVHFTGAAPISNVSVLYIFPALWGCTELVGEFLEATRVSVSATDMTALFCYIFITLYLFSHAMVVSKIKGRNPVKASVIYGLPAISLSLSYGVYLIVTGVTDGLIGSQIVKGSMFAALALYALSFTIELFRGIMTKDEVEIVDSIDEAEEEIESCYAGSADYEDLVVAGNYENRAPDYTSLPTDDADDFIIGYDVPEETPAPTVADILLKNEEKPADPEIKSENKNDGNEPSRMSEIDQLLAELESKK